MTDLSTLRALQKRIREATGPDRELDAAIMFSLFAKSCGQSGNGTEGYLWPENDPSWSFAIKFPDKDREWFKKTRKGADRETLLIEDGGALVLVNALRVPKLTTDPDGLGACVALMREVLPGWDFELTSEGRCGDFWAALYPVDDDRRARILGPDNDQGLIRISKSICCSFIDAIISARIAELEAEQEKERVGCR